MNSASSFADVTGGRALVRGVHRRIGGRSRSLMKPGAEMKMRPRGGAHKRTRKHAVRSHNVRSHRVHRHHRKHHSARAPKKHSNKKRTLRKCK